MTPALPLLVFLAAFADDPLPAGASVRLGSTRMRVTGVVHGLQFATAGRLLVAADRDAVIGWDYPTGVRLFRHPYPPYDSILAGRVTAKFELVLLLRAKENEKLTIVRMNLATGKCSPGTALEYGIGNQAVFRADGAVVAFIQKSRLAAFDAVTGKPLWETALPQASANPPVFSGDGTTVAVEADKDVWVLDAATGKKRYALPAIHKPVVSPDGSLVAGAGTNENSTVYRDGKPSLTVAAEAVIGFSPDGMELFGTRDGRLRVFDPHTGKQLREFAVPERFAQSLSPDGTLLCGEAADAVVLLDAKTGVRLGPSADPPGLPAHLTVRRGTVTGLLKEWNAAATWAPAARPGTRLAVKPFAGTVVGATPGRTVTVHDDAIVVRHAETDAVLGGFTHAGAVPHLAAVCPDTGAVVVSGEVGVARWVPGAKEKVVLPTTANDRPAPTAVTTAGDVTAIAYPPGLEGGRPTVELFRGTDHRHTVSLDGEARKLALSADGGILAAECDLPNGNIGVTYAATVIDTATGRMLFRTPSDHRRDAGLAVSACGRTVARTTGAAVVGNGIPPVPNPGTGPDTGGARVDVFEVRTGTVRRRIATGAEPVSLAIDRQTLFTAQPGGPVLVWPVGLVPLNGTAEKAWGWLTAGTTAAEAQAWLTQNPDAAVRLAAEYLKPVPPVDTVKLAQWVADLDAPQFAVRQTAANSLRKLGELATPALQHALDTTRSSEVREKVKGLLTAVPKPDNETLRALRLIEVLEWQTTPAAAAELKRLAAGAPGAALTRDAAAALARLK